MSAASAPMLNEVVRRLVEAYSPERIYLFGSVARGEAGPDSDYDIMVIVPDDAPPERLRSRLAYRALRGTGTAADVVVGIESIHCDSKGIAGLLPIGHDDLCRAWLNWGGHLCVHLSGTDIRYICRFTIDADSDAIERRRRNTSGEIGRSPFTGAGCEIRSIDLNKGSGRDSIRSSECGRGDDAAERINEGPSAGRWNRHKPIGDGIAGSSRYAPAIVDRDRRCTASAIEGDVGTIGIPHKTMSSDVSDDLALVVDPTRPVGFGDVNGCVCGTIGRAEECAVARSADLITPDDLPTIVDAERNRHTGIGKLNAVDRAVNTPFEPFGKRKPPYNFAAIVDGVGNGIGLASRHVERVN